MISHGTAQIAHPDRFFIAGQWVEPSGTRQFDVYDGTSEEVFLSVAEAEEADMERAVAAARQAFDHGPWPRMSPGERAIWLNKIADEWAEHGNEIADFWTLESGIVRSVSAIATGTSEEFRYYAGLADTFAWEDRRVGQAGEPSLVVSEPVGVVGIIVPWNGTNGIMASKVAPALMAGCTVVIKASPEAPASPLIFAEICAKVGLPDGVVNVLTADREVSEALVRNPGVDKISFTGSTVAGRRIASICGDRIARYTLELGGKSPALIMDDFDVAEAAARIAQSSILLTGQSCSILTRVIVARSRHDEFVDALASALAKVRVGDPFDPQTQMGPLAMERQRYKVEYYIAKGIEEGATLALGGGRPKHLERGYFIEPTVFGNVDNNSTIAREEIFGPVVSVIAADHEDHAVDIANDSIFGLNASVFTDDEDKAYAVARRLRSGTVGHNSWKTDFSLGFGGFKQSGIGREGGVAGLLPYLESKAVIFERMPKHRR